ncbi:MAG: hypothetical protein NC910_04545 [Candidatus Omnitrophica bacterium]|nr:hypothetical protein [Candidatus Omnitrophota bacterium]
MSPHRRAFLLFALLLAAAMVGLCLPAAAQQSPPDAAASTPKRPESILVDDFETGATQGLFAERNNRLDAFQGTWARRPSYTVITKVPDTRPGKEGRVLRLEFSKTGGWCGWYTLLNGIDVTKHNALTFWVRGEQGGERFDIGMADETMQDLEIDSVYVGSIMSFLDEGVTTDWQQVKVPLIGLRTEMNMSRMGSLVLWFRYEGQGAIQIDDIMFTYDEDVERMQEENKPKAVKDPRFPRYMWVWKTDPLARMDVRQELLGFCKATAIDVIYIYLGEEPIDRTPESYQQSLAEFLKDAHAAGVKVEALQGNPLWALKANHQQVLDWVGGYLNYNTKRPAEEKIDGVSLDIEPYLTSEWETGDREQLTADFLELLAALRELIDKKQGDHHFEMGAAIPVFYKSSPELEEGILKNVDYAALMDYYDTATDIIENARFHIDMANRTGKKMVIGVETQDLVQMNQGKRRNTFHEEGWADMERELIKVAETFMEAPGFGGLAIHCYESYRLLQKGRNVPVRERSEKIPKLDVARSEKPVAIDGDLADWEGTNWILLNKKNQVVYGVGAWSGPHDISFKLGLRWEPDAILMAVEVQDNTIVQEKTGGDMWEGDHLEVWFDADLYGDFKEAVNSSDDFQFGFSPGNFGSLKPEAHVWVPSIEAAVLKQIQIAARTMERGYAMEIRIPASVLFQGVVKKVGVKPEEGEKLPGGISKEQYALQMGVLNARKLQAGFRLGMMFDGSDTDETRQPQKCLMSTSPERQWGDPTSFNILELKE